MNSHRRLSSSSGSMDGDRARAFLHLGNDGSSNEFSPISITSSSPPPSSPFPAYNQKPNLAPFKPSIAVIVGVLTTMFSITFLLLLYAKHCKGRNRNQSSSPVRATTAVRKNSGIDGSVIESLPIFRFASLRGQKEGLECAVCLNRFEPTEVLKLLPKCKHAFHVECVDTWLDAHSTCPLCRYRVDPEDILLLEETKFGIQGSIVEAHREGDEEEGGVVENRRSEDFSTETIHRISGRHSSAGERGSHFLVQRPGTESEKRESLSSTSRRSLDTCLKKKTESVSIGCFDRGSRKDGSLLPEPTKASSSSNREDFLMRFEHRIILSNTHRRWSDFRPSDLVYLRSQMMIAGSSSNRTPPQRKVLRLGAAEDSSGGGRSVINARSVSEITGLSRFTNGIQNVGPTTRASGFV